MRILLSITLWMAISIAAWADGYKVSEIPNPQTLDAYNFVSNPDGVLSTAAVDTLNRKILELKIKNGTEVNIVAINRMAEGEDIDEFATALFERWKIGDAQTDNGLLILFAKEQRKIVFRTGYGLEGALTDIATAQIIRNVIAPHFRESDYDGGIIAAFDKVLKEVGNENFLPQMKPDFKWDEKLPFVIALYFVIIIITLFWGIFGSSKICKNPKLKSNIDRYQQIRELNGSVIAFFAVLVPIVMIIVSYWLPETFILQHFVISILTPLASIPAAIFLKIKKTLVRRSPIDCTRCGGKMHILSEKEEDVKLNVVQQFEENLKSVDYDVFVCTQCGNEAIYAIPKRSSYSDCPSCHTKAFVYKSTKTLISPTYSSTGKSLVTNHCIYCGYEVSTEKTLPKLTHSSSGSGGSSGGSSGGGGGGGGSTGGGGSSGSW